MELDEYTCEEAFRRLDDYLDRELAPRELALVEQHLQVCARCAHEFRFEARVLERVRQNLQRVAAPPGLKERVQAALRAAAGNESP
jgi:anti-sigma factor (TIGR02949 family)